MEFENRYEKLNNDAFAFLNQLGGIPTNKHRKRKRWEPPSKRKEEIGRGGGKKKLNHSRST